MQIFKTELNKFRIQYETTHRLNQKTDKNNTHKKLQKQEVQRSALTL